MFFTDPLYSTCNCTEAEYFLFSVRLLNATLTFILSLGDMTSVTDPLTQDSDLKSRHTFTTLIAFLHNDICCTKKQCLASKESITFTFISKVYIQSALLLIVSVKVMSSLTVKESCFVNYIYYVNHSTDEYCEVILILLNMVLTLRC